MTDTRTPRQIVEAAKARAEADPSILIQGSFARGTEFGGLSPVDPKAVCFCTIGLIANEAGIDTARGISSAVSTALHIPRYALSEVMRRNDQRANRLPRSEVKSKCPHEYAAGLKGFDYLLEHLP